MTLFGESNNLLVSTRISPQETVGVVTLEQVEGIIKKSTSKILSSLNPVPPSPDSSSSQVTYHRYWAQFLLWDFYKRPEYGPDVPSSTEKYLIYRCDSGRMSVCGGWADRLKGLVFSYLLANLTGRVFKAQILNPDCDLSHYLVPNRVNWSYSIRDFPSNANDYGISRKIDDHGFKGKMNTMNLTQEFNTSLKYIYFQGNLEDVTN